MAAVFLSEILLILPPDWDPCFQQGEGDEEREFEDVEDQEAASAVGSDWDTIVVPAKEDGFRSVFLGKNCCTRFELRKRIYRS